MIQRGILLGLSVGCLGAFVPVCASAQDTGTIKVIRDDGAIQSIEIPKNIAKPEGAVVTSTPKSSPKVMSAEDLMKQMEEAIGEDSVQATTDTAIETDSHLPETILKERSLEPIPADAVPIYEPKNIAPVEAKKEKPKKKSVVKKRKRVKSKVSSKKNVHHYQPSSMPPPLPRLKPEKPTYVVSPSRITDYTDLPSNVKIDKDVALRIALEYAPPARSFTVYEGRQYKDRIVYQVTFRTEGGPHDILVDAETGDVLKR